MNFPDGQMNMVRLGISLYGSYNNTNLQQISKLKSVVSQNRNIKKGEGVDTWEFYCTKTMNISVIPVGYGDKSKQKVWK